MERFGNALSCLRKRGKIIISSKYCTIGRETLYRFSSNFAAMKSDRSSGSWVIPFCSAIVLVGVLVLSISQFTFLGGDSSSTRIERSARQLMDEAKSPLMEVMNNYARLQRQKLNSELPEKSSVFEDVEISYPLSSLIIGNGNGENIKAIIRPDLSFPSQKKCVVYGMGIASDSTFESQMVPFCEVHGFDCSVKPDAPSVASKKFIFHPLCIGEKVKANTVYMKDHPGMKFSPLKDVMANLNHHAVDMLKMDIEGGEWAVLENDILRDGMRPVHLLFELHSHCAKPKFVPQELTRGRDKAAVNRLFAALFDAGYRVVSKEVNRGDLCCAEFVLILDANSPQA